MKKCEVCGKEFENENPSVLFINDAGEDVIICDECEHQSLKLSASDFEEGGSINEKFAAAEYLRKCAASCESQEVSKYLKEALAFNGFTPENKKPSLWISATRISAGAIFIVGLISAFMLKNTGKIDSIGFVIIAVSSLIVLSVLMMLAEAAQNVEEIKEMLKNKLEK